jgi:group I intron endonuclease
MDFICENKKALHCCGVYRITHVKSGKNYIGSSKEIYIRIAKHKYQLLRNKHDNNHLQNAVNKYEISSFEVAILEVCSVQYLANREQHWIDNMNTTDRSMGYNKCKVSDNYGNVMTEETKKQISSTLMKNKTIKMRDKISGKLVRSFSSLYEAAVYVQTNGFSLGKVRNIRMKISEAIRNKKVPTGLGKHGVRASAYGYKWEV